MNDPAGDGSGLAARALPSPRPSLTLRAWKAARWGPLGVSEAPAKSFLFPLPRQPPIVSTTRAELESDPTAPLDEKGKTSLNIERALVGRGSR